jgi:hypothetical protein
VLLHYHRHPVGEKISTTTPLTQQKLFSPGVIANDTGLVERIVQRIVVPVRKLNLKPASGYYSDLTSVYQGEDQGKGCYFTIFRFSLRTVCVFLSARK